MLLEWRLLVRQKTKTQKRLPVMLLLCFISQSHNTCAHTVNTELTSDAVAANEKAERLMAMVDEISAQRDGFAARLEELESVRAALTTRDHDITQQLKQTERDLENTRSTLAAEEVAATLLKGRCVKLGNAVESLTTAAAAAVTTLAATESARDAAFGDAAEAAATVTQLTSLLRHMKKKGGGGGGGGGSGGLATKSKSVVAVASPAAMTAPLVATTTTTAAAMPTFARAGHGGFGLSSKPTKASTTTTKTTAAAAAAATKP
jgi:hypothetical protein